VWIAADVGIVIQPANARAQLEGGAIFGLSNALMERITIRNGVAQQTNFHDYPVMRMASAPSIQVQLLRNEHPPTGIGETGTVVAPAALANALASLTGRRLRHMPFTADRVKEALS
jgi:isoquinoline 1-oxidoreductase beta subunit